MKTMEALILEGAKAVAAAVCPPLEEGSAPFINRELSWMAFNERVLDEARDKRNPLFERLNFLAITVSNLDEFFMIRVASLIDLIQSGHKRPDASGMTPTEQMSSLMKRNKQFFKRQYSSYNRQILPALKAQGIRILSAKDIDARQELFLADYFERKIKPILTPLAVDAGRPFPLLYNKSVNLFVRLDLAKEPMGVLGTFSPFSIVQIPRNIPRLIALPTRSAEGQDFILLENVVRHFIDALFDNVKIQELACFRIMRNADFEIDEDETSDLLVAIEARLRQRQWGQVIRLEVEHDASSEIREVLMRILPVPAPQVFRIRGPIDLCFLQALPSHLDRPDLHYPPFKGQPSPAFHGVDDPFQLIKERDVFLHHPFESFDPVIDMIKKASTDPKVLAIKQTLYRVSGNSPIIAALAKAALAGKQVLVLVELKARFDEEQNIHWARELERAGCHVIYGLKGLKTHSKITLIVREEGEDLVRYVHVGTGNYNDSTAKVYTDLGLWTASEKVGNDASHFFNMISGYAMPDTWQAFIPAPRWLRTDILHRIKREELHAKEGRQAIIVVKINSLSDTEIIEALYAASQAGVHIRLIVRGICCLRPGVAGLSERIAVRSLVGRYLEHSRIFYFYNDGAEDLLIGSADWMPRNMDRRIELLIPLTDPVARARCLEILQLNLRDTERARMQACDGTYHAVDKRGKDILDSQEACSRLAEQAIRQEADRRLALDHYEPVYSPQAFQEEKQPPVV